MKKQIIITSFLILVSLALIIFSIYQTIRIEKEVSEFKRPQIKKEEKIIEEASPLIRSKPEDYGMIVIDDRNRPATQEEWDSLFAKKIKALKSQTPSVTWNKLDKKIKEEPQKTKDKLKQIDSSIEKSKLMLNKDPNNKEIKQKLDRLMMLRSIAKELADR